MRKFTLFTLLVALVMVLAACGDRGTVSPESETAPSGSGESEAGGGAEGTTSGAAEGEGGDAGGDITIEGLDTLKYNPAEVSVAAGQPVNITLNNKGVLPHNIVWTEGDELFVEAVGGTTDVGTRTFDAAGEYEFYCSVPGHKEAGMVGKVVVQ